MAAPAAARGAVTSAPNCAGGQVDPDALAVANDIVAIQFPPEQREATMRQMMDALSHQMQVTWGSAIEDEGLRAILSKDLDQFADRIMPVVNKHIPNIMNAMACAYARNFEISDLRNVRTFAQTASGAKFLQIGPKAIADPSVAAANQAYFSEVQTYFTEYMEKVNADVSDYHASKSKKSKKPSK